MQDSYSLSEICDLIGEIVETALPQTFRVRAEISSLSSKGGHCYMDLIEKAHSSALLSAKVRAVCWSNVWNMLSAYFIQETGQMLCSGMQVLVEAQVNFHAVYGMSLQIVGIDPAYTLGGLATQRRKTIEQLQKEGMTELQSLLKLPILPIRIAVVSSPDAAGYDDFTHQLQSSSFCFTTHLFPAIMQGDRAAESVIQALGKIYDEISDFDAVVIIRGGGATTDLTCFDNYDLALHIAQFPTPVITGIGHQRDISVADMVSFKSVKTPTAAAAFLIERVQLQQEQLTQLKNRLNATATLRLSAQRNKLEKVKFNLLKSIETYLQHERNRLALASKTISLLSPEDIYRKGYSLTKINGQIIKSAAQVQAGHVITTELADGVIKSTVFRD